MSIVIGVDIGGSHITTAVVDSQAKSILKDTAIRKTVNAQASSDVIFEDWCNAIKQTARKASADSYKIGIAMPGPFDYEAGISLITDQEKFTALYQLNIKDALSIRLGIPPGSIKFINDAAAFLQGEVYAGSVNQFHSVLGLTLGTGLGSALCKDGEAVDADLWNSIFKDGIAEDYISTRWFVKKYYQLSSITVSGVKELLEMASYADRKKIFFEFSNNLKLFLIPQIKAYQVQGILFGGNISNACADFFPLLQKQLLAEGLNVSLKRSILNEDAALIGAASTWLVVKNKGLKILKTIV
jgi:glucokinase